MTSWIRQLLDGGRGGGRDPSDGDEHDESADVPTPAPPPAAPQPAAPRPPAAKPVAANRTGSDRRGAPRIPLQLQVRLRFTSADAMTACRTFDISETGAFIELRHARPPGTQVRLTLQIGSQTLVVGGIVMRSSDGSDGSQPGMGIRFTELTADAAEHLAQLLDE